MTVEIWINLTCTRCSSALFLFEQEGRDYSVRRYLDDPPSADEFRDLLHRLGSEPWDIVRVEEPVAREIGLVSWERSAGTRGQWIEAMVRHPILIQCPVITADDGTAVLALTREAVRSVLRSSASSSSLSLSLS
jgi:arsenate reductase (glutaredoxin)